MDRNVTLKLISLLNSYITSSQISRCLFPSVTDGMYNYQRKHSMVCHRLNLRCCSISSPISCGNFLEKETDIMRKREKLIPTKGSREVSQRVEKTTIRSSAIKSGRTAIIIRRTAHVQHE